MLHKYGRNVIWHWEESNGVWHVQWYFTFQLVVLYHSIQHIRQPTYHHFTFSKTAHQGAHNSQHHFFSLNHRFNISNTSYHKGWPHMHKRCFLLMWIYLFNNSIFWLQFNLIMSLLKWPCSPVWPHLMHLELWREQIPTWMTISTKAHSSVECH